jgi:hypothetical protein
MARKRNQEENQQPAAREHDPHGGEVKGLYYRIVFFGAAFVILGAFIFAYIIAFFDLANKPAGLQPLLLTISGSLGGSLIRYAIRLHRTWEAHDVDVRTSLLWDVLWFRITGLIVGMITYPLAHTLGEGIAGDVNAGIQTLKGQAEVSRYHTLGSFFIVGVGAGFSGPNALMRSITSRWK